MRRTSLAVTAWLAAVTTVATILTVGAILATDTPTPTPTPVSVVTDDAGAHRGADTANKAGR